MAVLKDIILVKDMRECETGNSHFFNALSLQYIIKIDKLSDRESSHELIHVEQTNNFLKTRTNLI